MHLKVQNIRNISYLWNKYTVEALRNADQDQIRHTEKQIQEMKKNARCGEGR